MTTPRRAGRMKWAVLACLAALSGATAAMAQDTSAMAGVSVGSMLTTSRV